METNILAELIIKKKQEMGLKDLSVWSAADGPPREDCEVIPTGSLALDLAMGVGGFPRGRLIQLAGPEGSGKSLLSLHTIREAQKIGLYCIYIDVERSFNLGWAKGFGVDPERLLVVQPEEGQECFEFLLGKKKVPGVLGDAEFLRTEVGELGLVVIDSLAMIIPPLEFREDDLSKQQIAPLARFLTPILRKLVPALHSSNVMLIVINQLREKVGQMWGDPTTTPGGRSFKHACSVMVSMASLSGKDSLIANEGGIRIGHLVRCRVQKNKVAPPFRQASFPVYYREGIDLVAEVIEYGLLFGLIKRSGASYQVDGIGDSIRGRGTLVEILRGQPDIVKSLEEEIRVLSVQKETIVDSISAEVKEEEEDDEWTQFDEEKQNDESEEECK